MFLLLNYFISAFFVCVSYRTKCNIVNTSFILLLVILWIVTFTFRVFDFGMIDIVTYYKIFNGEYINDISDNGIYYLNSLLVLLFGSSYLSFSFSTSLIITSLIFVVFYSLDKRTAIFSFVLFSSSTFFFIFEVNTFRSALGTLLICIALFSRQLVIRYLFFVLAFFIHKTMLFYMLIYFLSRIKFSKMLFIIVPFIALFTLMAKINFTGFALDIIAYIPVFEKKALVARELMGQGEFGFASFNHKNVYVFICLVLYYFNWRVIRLEIIHRLHAMVLIVLAASIFISGNVLVYDRLLMLANFLSIPLTVYIGFRIVSKNSFYFLFLGMYTISFSTTVFFWLPRNVISEYSMFIF